MHNDDSAQGDLHKKLLTMICWTQRTGWPTRAADTEVATRIFDAWWEATEPTSRRGEGRDRQALLEALDEAFRTTHKPPVAECLCATFAVAFEQHIRSREDALGGGE